MQLVEATHVGHRLVLLEQARDDLQPFFQALHARRHVAQLVAKHLVFALQPASAQPQDQPPTTEIVERRGLPGEQHRIAEGEGRDERAEGELLGMVGEVAQRDHQLEGVQDDGIWGHKVIGAKQAGEAGVFHRRDQALPAGPGQASNSFNGNGEVYDENHLACVA